MILISNDRTSASKKINGMALIRTLMVSTTAFERTKENSMVFGRLIENQRTQSDSALNADQIWFKSYDDSQHPYRVIAV